MARIRSVHPELATSETAASWPREVRYGWVLLWGYLDDYGRGLDNARVIASQCFPLDDDVTGSVMEEWLVLYEQSESICRYTHDGKRYLHALNWTGYQKPQHPGKVRIPPCPVHQPEEHEQWLATQAPRLTTPSRKSHEGLVTVSPTSKEGEGELSKEKGGGGRAAAPPTPPPSTAPPTPTLAPAAGQLPPARCAKHLNWDRPPDCGRCKDARLAREHAITALDTQTRAHAAELAERRRSAPWCGDAACSPDHFRDTALGVIKCPLCHPDVVGASSAPLALVATG